MSEMIKCDGCGAVFKRHSHDHAIHGARADGMSGAHPLPGGQFDWCGRCARVAFAAVLGIEPAP